MPFNGYLDEAHQFAISGWIHCDSNPSLVPFVDVVINRRCVASIPAVLFREDLRTKGFGDGYRAFSFNPFESLVPGLNRVEVFVCGSDQLLPNGSQVMSPDRAAPVIGATEPAYHDPSQVEAFIGYAERFVSFVSAPRILEVGPGLLLPAILPRAGGEAVFFSSGSPDDLASKKQIDLILSFGFCESIFPSIAALLRNAYNALSPDGIAILDFACQDPRLVSSSASFHERNGSAFIRLYSEAELRGFFVEASFEVLDVSYLEPRAVIAARKPKDTE